MVIKSYNNSLVIVKVFKSSSNSLLMVIKSPHHSLVMLIIMSFYHSLAIVNKSFHHLPRIITSLPDTNSEIEDRTRGVSKLFIGIKDPASYLTRLGI